MTLPFIMSKDAITVMVNGTATTVREGQVNFAALREALRAKDWDRVAQLATPAKAIETFAQGSVQVSHGQVLLNGSPVSNAVTRRILEMVGEGFDADPLMRFLERLMQNPSRTAVEELYLWLEGTSLPITEDGCFMAYKKVNDSYRDFYTGRVLNKPAELMTDEDREYIQQPQGNVTVAVEDGVTVLSMPRNAVDDVRDRTCSHGLHFCSLSYLPSYHGGQGRVLLVKIDPADVVSIPSDYDNAKGRAWRYRIVGEHVLGEQTEAYHTPVATTDGKPKTGSYNANRTAEAQTWVMGVNFGIVSRADQVRELLTRCVSNSGEGRSAAQGRVDGFDDAWIGRNPDLGQFGGSHLREAVEYAAAYFEGYDRCRGHAPQVQADVSEPATAADEFDYESEVQRLEILNVLNSPITGQEQLHGQYQGCDHGYDDGANDRWNDVHFDLRGALRGGRGYRRGYIRGYLTGYNGK